MSGSDVNFSLTTFSKNGKLLQIEYALNRVQQGKTSLGVRASNGVVIVTDKKLPTPLIVNEDYHKIEMITPQAAFIYSGMGTDYRVLVKLGRKIAQEYYLMYHEFIPIKMLVKAVSEIMQEYTQSGGVRPFGVSLLVSGGDADGSHLYQVDPSGTYFEWKASAIGKNYQNAKTFLERRYDEEIELDDAVHIAILTLRESFDGEMNANNIEVAIYREFEEDDPRRSEQGKNGIMKILSIDEISDYLQEEEL